MGVMRIVLTSGLLVGGLALGACGPLERVNTVPVESLEQVKVIGIDNGRFYVDTGGPAMAAEARSAPVC
jgi:hypothetical protein